MKLFYPSLLLVFLSLVGCVDKGSPSVSATTDSRSLKAASLSTIQDSVAYLYNVILDRQPDEGGLQYWTNEIQSGRQTFSAVMKAFIFSPEFHNIASGKSDSDFLIYAYHKCFNREPDTGGFNWWLGQIQASQYTHESAFFQFTQSPEFRAAHPELFLVTTIPTPTTVAPTNGACNTKADFNNTFVTNAQKFIYKLYAGQTAATAFNSKNLIDIQVSTSETIMTPQEADHEIVISKCPGDFTLNYPCRNQFNFVGGYIGGSTAAKPPMYKCPLEPNTTYYMNVRQIKRGSVNEPSCSQGEGCEVRVQIQGYE